LSTEQQRTCTVDDCAGKLYARGLCNKHYQRQSRNGTLEIKRRNPVLSMSEADLAWLAGLLEGEGSFFMVRHKGYQYPKIVVSMTDLDVIERVAAMFGVAVFYEKERPGRKPSFRASTTGHKATGLITQLLPWMGERRSQKIKELLNAQVGKVDG
jgi:hypothetical protein